MCDVLHTGVGAAVGQAFVLDVVAHDPVAHVWQLQMFSLESDRTLLPGEHLVVEARCVHTGCGHNLLHFVLVPLGCHEDVVEMKERLAHLSEHTDFGALTPRLQREMMRMAV